MAKRAQKVQVENMVNETVDETVIGQMLEQEVQEHIQTELDASGRKKKVDIAHEQLEELGLKNTSQIIRYLDSQNFSRSAIANFTGKRYQHVRNVLVTPLKKG